MEISDFTRDLSAEANAGLLEKPIGRDTELDFIMKSIAQDGKSNVLIIGPAGVGKTVLAEGLACILSSNEVPANFPKKKVLELNLTAMNSGAMYVGQFEERVMAFIDTIKRDPSIVVFIDEIHMLMGFGKAGDGGAARDLSQIIKPPLARGEICCLGATTNEEFERYIRPDAAFVRRFQMLELAPLKREAVFQILKRCALKNKYTNGIEFTDDTLALLVDVSDQIYPRRFQPDKSLDLLRRLLIAQRTDTRLAEGASDRRLLDYISLLKKELGFVARQDYDSLGASAKAWMGIKDKAIQTVDLSREQIISLLASK